MKPLKTLRARFALWTAGLLLVALTLFGLFVYVRMAQSLADAVDNALRLTVSQMIAEVNFENGELVSNSEFIEDLPNTLLFEQGFSFRIFDSAGQTLQEYGPYRNLPYPQVNFTAPNQPGLFATYTDAAAQDRLRLYTAPIVENNRVVGVIQAAQNLDSVGETLNQLLASLLIGVPLIVVVAGLGGYALAARALAPIDKITRTARRISAQDLSARLNLPAADDEVGRLADTFDSMLARLDEAFQRERQFTADASHELRTPLAAIQAILNSTLARQRSPDQYEQALLDLSEETGRLRTLAEGLLQLARPDLTQLASIEQVNLSTLLTDVSESLRPLAQDKGLQLTCNISQNLTLPGDSDALIRLFVNVVGNAIKYTSHGYITIAAASGANGVLEVTVTDTGIGIAPQHLPHIFDRFYRVDESRATAGAGLGLAMALKIARMHGGNITVNSVPGQGTTFTILLSSRQSPAPKIKQE